MKQLLTYQLFVNWRCEGNFAAAIISKLLGAYHAYHAYNA